MKTASSRIKFSNNFYREEFRLNVLCINPLGRRLAASDDLDAYLEIHVESLLENDDKILILLFFAFISRGKGSQPRGH